MYWKSILFVACIMVLTIGSILQTSMSASGPAAPYTQEAYKNVEKIRKEYPPQVPSANVAPIDRHRAFVEYYRELYKRAGYDWDATIRTVADDLRNKSNKIPDGVNNASMVVLLMSIMKSDCEHHHINCLDMFDSETSEAIKWLWGNTDVMP